jgi:hypothetical protein
MRSSEFEMNRKGWSVVTCAGRLPDAAMDLQAGNPAFLVAVQ